VGIAGLDQRFPIHRIYCVGRNFAAHAREMGGQPDRAPPFFFAKPADAVIQADRVPYPHRTSELHHEVELVVALNSGGRGLTAGDATACIYGHAIGVDLTRRDLQSEAKAAGRPWETAKAFDASAPISDIVPVAGTGHPRQGAIRLKVNGESRQSGRLEDMIWPVPEMLAELSSYFELQAGDLVFTGTPAGVGRLLPGDRVQATIDGLGSLEFEMDG